MKTYKLAASLICSNVTQLEKDVMLLTKQRIDQFHCDVMDGLFVPRFGMYPEMFTDIRRLSTIPIDVHFMIQHPERYIDTFYKAGVNTKNDYMVIHFESTSHPHRVIRMIKERGVKAGIALNISTPLTVLDYIAQDVDLVLLMGINPGVVGDPMISSIIAKIVDLRKKLEKYPHIVVEVDGGVTHTSSKEMVGAGADILVCGTKTLFNKEGLRKNLQRLRRELDRV